MPQEADALEAGVPDAAATPADATIPPLARVLPTQRELHGQTWTDEYAWMRQVGSAELAEHLRAERDHYDAATAHLRPLAQALFGEMEHRILPTDESVSWTRGDTFYYTRTTTGSE